MRGIRSVLFFMPLALLLLQSQSFELQDTIHALIQENIHLHDQLENLTQALRELKQMLWHHSNAINAETHLFLEHAFCGHELHHSAAGLQAETSVRLLTLPGLTLLLLLLRDL
ncbi:Fucolectin-2 [Dissostichus eleginoides]|uniref:Fucolectin-2 n=1 Tax=Dissostichus eleginoides TaxID=100907 RepID=A0AAD9BIE3_DISEL|nr:Fucolectin-2 [Dissostichus eleginoides]